MVRQPHDPHYLTDGEMRKVPTHLGFRDTNKTFCVIDASANRAGIRKRSMEAI
jgi:hypothetical protein